MWVHQHQVASIIDPVEKSLMSELKIAYQRGKGNGRLVPVLITPDVIPALRRLADEEYRSLCGVREHNPFLFPCIQNSSGHVMGWHAVSAVCQAAQVKDKSRMTSTKNRHRVSTLFAAMDLPSKEKEAFFEQMGHSRDVNESIYQAPKEVTEITKVARGLQQIDQGKNAHIHRV